MKNAIYLDSDFVREKMDSVNVLLRRFETLINSTDGVLTGQMIWRNILHALNINTKQEIIDAFGLFSLDDKIYDIKSVVLYKDAKTYSTYLLFNVRNANEEKIDNSKAAEAFAKVYARLNELQEKTNVKIDDSVKCGTECVAKDISDIYAYINKIETNSQLKANIEVTTDGASVSFPKDDPVEHDIVNNVFDSVRAVYKGLNNIKSETGVKTGVAITGLGIHFDSVKDKLGFSISVEKKELDNAADMRMPIKNTIDIAIKKVTE